MTHAPIPDFSRPVPVRWPAQARAVAISSRIPGSSYLDLPNEPLPGEDEPWTAILPVRPDTAHVRALRILGAAGELLAAAIIIGGGLYLTGLASLL